MPTTQDSHRDGRLSLLSDACLAVLAAAHLVPVWFDRYLPTQDGPSHLDNALLLRELVAGSSGYAEFFAVRWEPFPNWGAHLPLAALTSVLPPLIAEKVLVSLYAIGTVLAARYLLVGVRREQVTWAPWSLLFVFSYPFMPTGSHSPWFALIVAQAALVLCAVAATKQFATSGRAAWTRFWRERGPFLVAALAVWAGYALLPRHWGRHGGYLSERLAAVAPLVFLACLPVPRGRWASRLSLVAALIAGTTNLWMVCVHSREGNRLLEAYTAGRDAVPRGSRVLPFTLERRERLQLLEHASHFYCLEPPHPAGEGQRGSIDWDNYEAQLPYFPVRFREGFAPPSWQDFEDAAERGLVDTVILWGPSPHIEHQVAERFELVFERGRLRIYRRPAQR